MGTSLWKFLTTDISELNWGKTEEIVKTGTDAAKAVFDLAKTLNEKKDQIPLEELKPYIQEISSLLDVFNGPILQLAGSAIPFAPIAITLLKLIANLTKKEATLEQCVALVSQVAYLESFQEILKEHPELKTQIRDTDVSESVAQKIKKLGEQQLDEREAKRAIAHFHESQLAEVFNEVLQQRLQESGLEAAAAKTLAERVSRKTDENLISALVEAGDAAKRLGEWYRLGGAEKLEKYVSIDEYLEAEIKPLPDEKIFDETAIAFRDLYVRLNVRLLDTKGDHRIPIKDPEQLEELVLKALNDENQSKKVLFVQGEAGRGKSVFCRMFADRVRQELHPSFTPILIRLRQLRVLESSLTDTLTTYLETVDFVKSDPGWLTDKNTRFLFLLDGFDELLLERGTGSGLKDFLQQVEDFQQRIHHRFLVTGRPLALQGIDRLLSQTNSLKRVAIELMDDSIQQGWLNKWADKVGTQEATEFQQFLRACPQEIQDHLAREPLLLYLLARMHREKQFNAQMFADTKNEIAAKIRIYDLAIAWVIEKQRQDENFRLTGLESEDLRQFLTEAALCVVQSGNETAKVAMLEARLKDSNDPVTQLIQKAREHPTHETKADKQVLNNLLTAFYIKPASGDKEGAVEFTHKSFGEFLFAERLMASFDDWINKIPKGRREEYVISTEIMDKQIYDLLGYGELTNEIVQYLAGLLAENSSFDVARLFERLQDFYLRWCDGEFIDAPSDKTNLPLLKKEWLRKQLPERDTHLGLRQVDIYAGLNAMILLLELHRYAQSQTNDVLKKAVIFHPCSQPGARDWDKTRLLRIIGYSQCLGVDAFTRILGVFLSGTNLSGAKLSGAKLSGANLSGANLSHADFSGANLSGANLSHADFSGANLSGANLFGANLLDANLLDANLLDANLIAANLIDTNLIAANLIDTNLSLADLSGADLSGADLSGANLSLANLSLANLGSLTFNSDTKWENARGLHEAVGVSSELAQQPRFAAAVALSRGISLVRDGQVEEAIAAYNQALSLYPNLQISAKSWNSLCWLGSLHGYATDVLYAGEKAVTLEPDNMSYVDTRGFARALTGNLTGALADFQAVSNSRQQVYSEEIKQRRQRWIESLKAGNNPFTPEELEALRQAEG